MKSIAIICGGGPAPGINTVISTVAKLFLKNKYRVIGIHHGYQGLFSDNPSLIDFDFNKADGIFNRGGSVLYMSRFKPAEEDMKIDFFVKNNVKLLVTIGGDDTANTANRITKFLEKQKIDIANLHVPKTIDNDLPLPGRNPTFGFQSAKNQGVKIGNIIEEEARTTRGWYILSAMGRSAGHLAFEIGTSCHFPMIIIPEMFNKTKVTLDKIIRLIISSILKRRLNGIEYGVAIVSEGVFHVLDESEIINSGIKMTYDAHGHPELGVVSKSTIFNVLLQQKVNELGLSVKSRPNDMGYELRCCHPIGFDLTLCTLLGTGVYQLFTEGKTGCMVTADATGKITPLYLNDLQNEEGIILPRQVNIHASFTQSCLLNLEYLSDDDLEAAKQYLDNPKEFTFNQILNW